MNIRKTLLIAFVSVFCCTLTAYAQSGMTDSEIMQFIVSENEKGTSRDQIITKLLEKGVSIEQIQKIRDKYEREGSQSQVGTRDISGVKDTKNRIRQNNGERANQRDSKWSHMRKRAETEKVDQSKLTPYQRRMYKQQQQDEMSDGIGWLMPDTLDIYDDIFAYPQDAGDTKRIFGHDIFNRSNLSFEPEMNIATPADYRIAAGDNIYIDIWGASQKSLSAIVSPEGDIEIEGYGPIHLSGLTVEKANKHLRNTLGQRYTDSQMQLTLGQTRGISIHVMGEVAYPGTYTLSAFATVFHALYMAGGANETGTLRDIKVYREGRLIANVDVYDYMLNGNLKGNVRLASGDVIVVGTYNCLVNITGKVKRPMYYEMRPNESVGTLIKYAGGFAGDAYKQSVRLVRKQDGMLAVYSIDEFEQNNFQLCDGDSLAVDSVLDRYSNMVDIRGAVFRPGLYQMNGGITTMRQLIEAAGGLTEDAFAQRVIVHRRKADRTLEAISFNAQELLANRIPDIPICNEDVVFVPSTKEIQEERMVRITGEVLYPGDYEYAENLTVEDLILQAGGLTDAASLVKVDVSRRIRDKHATQSMSKVAETYSFAIKDGFVVEGENGFALEPFDEVFVRRSPGYTEQEHVTVEGEIAFGGTYALTKKNSRLSDLVKAAGGLNNEAYAKGARLERKLTPAEKIKQQQIVKLITTGDSVDMRKLELGDTRFVGINLDKALENPGNDEWDIVLREGDKLIIPQFNNTVSINGEVMYPNTVAYKKGEKLSYYINQGGGYSLNAKKSRVFAVHMNGTVSRVKSAKDIQPGCEIIVPAKPKRKGISFTEILSLGTMTATLGTVIATLLK